MPKKSKQFVVATEGATVDGRTIDRQWIQQMAANYDPAVYQAGINIEHIRSYSPDSVFRNFGHVDALEAKENGDKKLQLWATINPTDELVALTKAKQKVFTSIEISPEFAGTGEAYLVGLAVTDTPASLGTGMLEFTAKNPQESPLSARKQNASNHFSACIETAFEFVDEADPAPSLLDKVKQIFARNNKTQDDRFSALGTAIEEVAEHGATQSDQTQRQFQKVDGEVRRLSTANKALTDRLEAMEKHFRETPAAVVKRPRADGGAEHQTDF